VYLSELRSVVLVVTKHAVVRVRLISELTCNWRFTMVNYMHVRSSGDPVEITGERDSLAINCDLITHAMDMLMSMCKLGNLWMSNSLWEFKLQRLCRGGKLSGHRNWHMYLLICVWQCETIVLYWELLD